MRIRRLELIRYGKFTDTVLELPPAQHDFHLVVGPNEAGKSTLRSAIVELLFGMPRSSPLGFLHPQSELRLGARLETPDGAVVFQRVKAARQTLRAEDGGALSEDLLAPLLGAADRSFFEQMFGLDHARLVAGGQSILDASRDVGQVLFQSAAGVASLGRVSEGLAQEAGRIWAPRRAADREYYQAADRLEQANDDLKTSMVRTRAWTDARAALDEVLEAMEAEKRNSQALHARRAALERVRRLAAPLARLAALQEAHRAAGEVLELPEDARTTLEAGQAALALAEGELRLRELDLAARRAARDAIVCDTAVLTHRNDIDALLEQAARCRDHEPALAAQQAEVARLLADAGERATQLGWPGDEPALRARLPSALALKTLARLLQARGGLHQRLRHCAEETRRAHAALDEARARVAEPPAAEPPALHAAIARAQALLPVLEGLPRRHAARDQARRNRDLGLAALAPWSGEPARLRTMFVPQAERIAARLNERQALAAAGSQAAARVLDAQEEVGACGVRVRQFAQAHRVVAEQDVAQARAARDAAWHAIRGGSVPPGEGADVFEAAMQRADALADARVASAAHAAELAGLQQQLEWAESQLSGARERQQGEAARLRQFQADWAAEADALGLPGLALDDMPSWLHRREQALLAAQAMDDHERACEEDSRACDDAAAELRAALGACGVAAPQADRLPALLGAAQDWRDAQAASRARHAEMHRTLQRGEQDLQAMRRAQELASEEWRQWENDWTAALAAVQLPELAGAATASVESAMEWVAEVGSRLTAVDRLRREEIARMQGQLADFAQAARLLPGRIGAPELAGEQPAEIAARLGQRLRQACADEQRARAADEALAKAQSLAEDARLRLAREAARLQPLLVQAGVHEPAEALPLVRRSDDKRARDADIAALRALITEHGDGLPIETLQAEVRGCDAAALPTLLDAVVEEQGACELRGQQLAARKVEAEQALDRMGGQPQGALAEARRQEALAAMGDAAHRYLQLATASRLLKWAVERYRDRHQGPMLARAGALFAQLTGGAFAKLLVDFEQTPPTLSAQRCGGAVVPVAGLSEGTRDQLYLALRLAALELHLEQSRPLPFVADDLFVNFDDGRTRAGLQVLKTLSTRTQVLFFTHHTHLVPIVREVFGAEVGVVAL
ncbi:AAA family ATPase [Ramlibacter sp. AN1015]|uniref:AAA family ATPase n=1 Tax=Ramlibacter sp. AN1015 TaxID=3133428 RepID=UPI0030BB5476